MVPACWIGCSAPGTAPWSGMLPSLWGDGELDTWHVRAHTQPHRCRAAACAVWLYCTAGGCLPGLGTAAAPAAMEPALPPRARTAGRPWCCSLAVSGGREPHAQHQRSPAAPLLRALLSPADGFCSGSCFV